MIAARRINLALTPHDFQRAEMSVELPQRRWVWTRWVAVVLTLAMLAVVWRQIDPATLRAAFARLRLEWFLLGGLVYGAAIAWSGYRWHVALRAVVRSLHVSASIRLMFIGHFFFTTLFGLIGGDLAKSALYARWFRFDLPEVLAAAPLDRMFAGLGTLCVAVGGVSLATVMGGGLELSDSAIPVAQTGRTILIVAVAVTLLLVLVRPQRAEGFWARTWQALRNACVRLNRTPSLAAQGLTAAFLSQCGLSAVLAISLQAVTDVEVPWARAAWAFCVITFVSGAPFSFAGAGVREAAAIPLLGLYGVPPADCVAAAWLTLFWKLAWAGIGAGMLWREGRFHRNDAERPLPRTISVVVPVLNEAAALPETLAAIRAQPEVIEIIIVDGGSDDATRFVATNLGCEVIEGAASRGGQLRRGAARARGDVVLLLHADTILPADAGRALLNCLRDPSVVAGGYWKVFRDSPLLLRGARIKCWARLVVGRRILGDQGLFVRRDVLECIGGVPDVPLMEEFELCRRLRRVGRLALADATVATSARRFRRLGVVRTYLRMAWVTARYHLGTPSIELKRVYEKE